MHTVWRSLVVFVLVYMPVLVLGAEDVQACYTYGGVAGIVVATVVVTVVMGGLAAAAVWYLWKQKTTALAGDEKKKKPGSTFFTSPAAMEKNCAGLEHPDKGKNNEGGVGNNKEAYAFDNPQFKDDEIDSNRSKNQDAAEKGEAGFRTDNGNVRSSQDLKNNAVSKGKKSRPFGNLQFPNVFHQGFKKTSRAMDDTFIPKPLERVEVPLRGHDFTGLGFNICGNMRDGIFVKDVLHRGPASESGKIKAGDRIVGVWVSFGGMVYEDALTILSYASPYDVRLELEKTLVDAAGKSMALPVSSPASKTRLAASSSFRTGQRLFHPLYRSQSFDDLTQIGKDNQVSLNNNNVSTTNSCSSCPKRSQSIEGATSPKPRVHQDPTKNRKSASSSEASKPTTPAISKVCSTNEIQHSKKAPAPAVRTPRLETESVQQRALEQSSRNYVNDVATAEVKPPSTREMLENLPKYQESADCPPAVPPRKSGNHVKRKAPSPPKDPSENASKTETSAIVHRDAEGEDVVDGEQFASGGSDGQDSEQKDPVLSEEASDVHSLSGESSTPTVPESEDPESSPKRKASSLGDLTKLDSGRQKKSTMASSPILERAVSLDLQQSLPEGNLVKQPKLVLESPTFEQPEDTTEEGLTRSNPESTKSPNLTRWDGRLLSTDVTSVSKTVDTVLENSKDKVGLWPAPGTVSVEISTPTVTNGHAEVQSTKEEEEPPSYVAFGVPSEDQIQMTSTPIKKVPETEGFFKDSVDIDDVPYLGDQSSETVSVSNSSNINSPPPKSVNIPPISLSIPVIKPNFSQYEVLPSPEKSVNVYTASSSSVSGQDSTLDDQKQSQDMSAVESAYKPVFSVSSYVEATRKTSQDSELSTLDIVNGNGLDVSTSSYGQYKTASEESASSANSTPLKAAKVPEITGIKVHSGAAGFAKTLIISSPIEGESIALNADDLSTPPPTLEPPPP